MFSVNGRKLIRLAAAFLCIAIAPRIFAQGVLVDTTSVKAGYTGSVSSAYYYGFISGSIGTDTPTKTSDGFTYVNISDDNTKCTPKRGCSITTTFSISGLPQNPTQAWLASVTANGVSQLVSNSTYSYSAGVATWTWTLHQFGFTSGTTYPVTISHNVIGYIDPKYAVVGVTYAPPGPSANTYVSYLNSTFVGNTTSLAQSFSSSTTTSVSITEGYMVAVSKGSIIVTDSTTATQTSKNTNTITTSFQVQSGEKTFGSGNYFTPVNHDYDTIWIWLNPAIIMTVGKNSVVWNGYGYDETDQAGMDIVGVQLGYLNGDFGAIPPDIQTSLNRTWAASQRWGAGGGPALTSADLAHIASADPFSVSTYGTNYIGYTPPAPETADHRFTLSACSSSASFNYLQASPSQTPPIYSCTLTYTNSSTQAQDLTESFAQTFSIDASVSATFVATVGAELKTANTLTWTTESQSSIANTTTSTASLSVQGPPCGNVSQGVGPCAPVYDSSGTQPTEFEVYQDNIYGTFMFSPVHFY
jgi:hypothetical protein